MGDRSDKRLRLDVRYRHEYFRSESIEGQSEWSRLLDRDIVEDMWVEVDGFVHNVYVFVELNQYSGEFTIDNEEAFEFVSLTVIFVDGYDRDEEQVFVVTEFERVEDELFLGSIDLGDGNVVAIELRVVGSARVNPYYV